MLYCDWCAEAIRDADYATLEVGGTYSGGKRIRTRVRAYHTSYEYSDGPPIRRAWRRCSRCSTAAKSSRPPMPG